MTTNISELNDRFARGGRLRFEAGPGGLAVARITSPLAEATISLSGGHVLNWQPSGQQAVLWLSSFAKFAPGKSIRGGVPVCWPWFGPHASEAAFPGHGFARTVPWQVDLTEVLPDGSARIELTLQQSDATRAQWSHPSSARLRILVGSELRIDLVTRNLGDSTFVLGEALHTYFAVGDVRRAPILGLEGATYLDKVDGGRRKVQAGPIEIAGEVDRVYLDTTGDCLIEDHVLARRIRIAKEGSASTVVWNPWIEKAEKMGDFGPDGHLGMVCVESGNALDNVVTIAPGAEHTMSVCYSVEPL